MNPTLPETSPPTCHQLDHAEVAQRLDVNPRAGLSAAEVQRRQAQPGPNRLTGQKRKSELIRFLLQFHQPLLYTLLAATAVTEATVRCPGRGGAG